MRENLHPLAQLFPAPGSDVMKVSGRNRPPKERLRSWTPKWNKNHSVERDNDTHRIANTCLEIYLYATRHVTRFSARTDYFVKIDTSLPMWSSEFKHDSLTLCYSENWRTRWSWRGSEPLYAFGGQKPCLEFFEEPKCPSLPPICRCHVRQGASPRTSHRPSSRNTTQHNSIPISHLEEQLYLVTSLSSLANDEIPKIRNLKRIRIEHTWMLITSRDEGMKAWIWHGYENIGGQVSDQKTCHWIYAIRRFVVRLRSTRPFRHGNIRFFSFFFPYFESSKLQVNVLRRTSSSHQNKGKTKGAQ